MADPVLVFARPPDVEGGCASVAVKTEDGQLVAGQLKTRAHAIGLVLDILQYVSLHEQREKDGF